MLLSGPTVEYHLNNVAVTQAIIENSNLDWDKEYPGNGNTAPGWNPYRDDNTPKRITEWYYVKSTS